MGSFHKRMQMRFRALTRPKKSLHFWLNTSDEYAKNWISIFSLKSREEIEKLEKEHEPAPHLRVLQKVLANEITVRSHSESDLQIALKTSDFLFGNGTLESLQSLNEVEVTDMFDGVPQFKLFKSELSDGINIAYLLPKKLRFSHLKAKPEK